MKQNIRIPTGEGTIMAKVFLICGKICSGKSTYARKLMENRQAVLLSADEIMLALFVKDA